MTKAFSVLTFTPKAHILKDGQLGNYSADINRVLKNQYMLVSHTVNREEAPGEGIPHRTGFLVCRITGAHKTPWKDNRGKHRIAIEFDEYAEINVPNAWLNESKNPCAYIELEDAGIDVAKLTFKKVAAKQLSLDSNENRTIEVARSNIAAHYNVSPEKVRISIDF